jgi:protein involved in polysaccharide export with SLBB domain
MKFSQITALLFTAFFFCSALNSFSQSLSSENLREVRVDALSDEEIKAYYQRATAAGFSQDQLIKLALERGMPAEELAKLRMRLTEMSKASTDTTNVNGATKKKESLKTTDRKVDDDAMKVPTRPITRDLMIFGSELFTDASSVFEPNLRIPSPANYILGPDDELTVNVFGYSEKTYELTVNAEGNVYIPNVGPVKVSGMTIEAAADKIRNKLAATIYKAIRTGQTKVEVSLGKIRSIRVTVIGQASKPGTYTVSSLTTLFNLLYQCGGPSDVGTFRNIELIRGSKVVRTVDLYAFLVSGDRKDNLVLQEQDVIKIPYYDTRVMLAGEIKRPGKYELLPGETFEKLLGFSGGFSDSAYRSLVKVTRLSDNGIELADIRAGSFASFIPRTGDFFTISKGLSRFINRVSLKGAVMRPGNFELKPGMTLKQLIEEAGGVRPDAFLARGFVSRLDDDFTQSSISFGVKTVMSGEENVLLKREDVVSISSLFDLKDVLTINIEGEVRKPGIYVFSENLMLKDLVLQAGGLTEAANFKNVEIFRRIKNPDVSQRDFQQSETIRADLSGGLSSAAADTKLDPYDMVVVRAEPGYNKPRWVYIEGQVMSPGKYALAASGERISDMVKRAGGFKGSADSSSITVRRYISAGVSLEERKSIVERLLNIERDSIEGSSRLRETYLKNVELLGVNVQKVKDNPGGSEDLILEDGDILTISRANNLVKVSGEVYNPTLLPFENNTTAKYYIKRSGNFTNNAVRNNVFVIYPDGRAKSLQKFLWFKSYPAVTPRSEVYVPSKPKDNKKGFGPGEWIAVSSIIASLATLIVAVVNATQ